MNLKSVIRNSVLKHPVLTSSLVWRKTPFCIINFVLLRDGACCCYFPTCWTQSAVCDWAFTPNSPLFHLLMGEVKLAGLNWLEYCNKPGPYWNPRPWSYPSQCFIISETFVIFSLIISFDYFSATWHDMSTRSAALPQSSVLSICLSLVIKRYQYCVEGRWVVVME